MFASLALLACHPAVQPTLPSDTPEVTVTATSARISPALPGPGEALRCATEPAGADMRWQIDGQDAGAGADLASGAAAGAVVTCSSGEVADSVTVTTGHLRENVLLVIWDDVGVDHIGSYHPGVPTPPTPNLDALADTGVRFARAWSNPVCSPTRAGLLTGLHASNHNVGTAITNDGRGLNPALETLPELLTAHGDAYTTAAFGKWHITGRARGVDAMRTEAGFDHFAGSIGNLGDEGDYFDWMRLEDGVETHTEAYATEDVVASTTAWLATAPEPFFAWVGIHAAHVPLHVPPQEWTHVNVDFESDAMDLDDALVSSADIALGRILSSLSPEVLARTTVIVLGDNGTAGPGVRPPGDPEQAKATLFEGGIHVPLVIAGPAVSAPGRVEPHPVSHVDLFTTIAELAGISLAPAALGEVDGRSLLPYLSSDHAPAHRASVYADSFSGRNPLTRERRHWRRAVRIGDWKLIRWPEGGETLFDLSTSGVEAVDLLATQPLSAEADAMLTALREALDTTYTPRPWDDTEPQDTGADAAPP